MVHLRLLLFVGMTFLLSTSKAGQPEQLLNIDFSLDAKADTETGHTVIQYSLTGEGHALDCRNIYDWAIQACRRGQLSKGEMDKITALLSHLPRSGEKDIPRDWLVTVRFRDGNESVLRRLHWAETSYPYLTDFK
ncbi:MAG TPA: hypothetical protein VFD58_13940 [Blastocatellia bacterium]|nr:hypothetical protein [Blastocatellia bacterium]